MNKSAQILAGVLVVQMGLAAFLLTREEPTSSFTATEALIALNRDQVSRIKVEEKDGGELKFLEILKKDGLWTLPGQDNFPASPEKITSFFDKIAEFKKTWPVGKTEIATRQFRVTEKDFERRITFTEGDKEKVIYLGSSPGFKKIHIRGSEDPFTYSVAFSAYEVPASSGEWTHKNLLKTERADIKEVAFEQLTLSSSEGDFVVTDLPAEKETILSKTSAIIGTVARGEFDKPAGLKSSITTGEKLLSFTLRKNDGSEKVFTYFRTLPEKKEGSEEEAGSKPENAEKTEDHELILTTSDSEFAFSLRESAISSLLKINAEDLIRDKKTDESGSDAEDLEKDKGASVEADQSLDEDQDSAQEDQDQGSLAKSKEESPQL